MNKKRVKRLWSLLGEERLDALLITTREMIWYVTGFSGSESVFLLTKRGGCLIVDSRYTSQARAECREFTVVEELSSLSCRYIEIRTTVEHFSSVW